MEIEELTKYGYCKLWNPKDNRHSLFLKIKYPNHDFYQGQWGPEILHLYQDSEYLGCVGKIYCTENRYKEIADWFQHTMFKP